MTARLMSQSAKFQSFGTFNLLHPTCAAMLEVPYPNPWEVPVAEQRRQFQRRLRDISGPIPSLRAIERVLAPVGESGVPISLCLLYTSPSPRDGATSRMPSSA